MIVDPFPFGSADDIVRRMKEVKANLALTVAPLSVIAELCKRGIKPLWAQMRPAKRGETPEVVVGGRPLMFDHFRIIESIKVEFTRLTPELAMSLIHTHQEETR